jgi:sulfite exporter TauE/SafE
MAGSDSSLLLTAWATGLLGSTHCAGMCGGISSALSFALPANSRSGPRLFAYQLAYNSGRILTYTLLGALVGTLAHGILGGWAQSPWPRVAAGLFMILLGLYLAGWSMLLQKLEGMGNRPWKQLAGLRGKILPVNHPVKAVAAGAVWGFLPCGLVYSSLTLALARADTVVSGGVMLAFGLGTLPMLLLTGTLAARLRQQLQKPQLRQLAGLLVMAFGLWTMAMAFGHAHHQGHHEGHHGLHDPAHEQHGTPPDDMKDMPGMEQHAH